MVRPVGQKHNIKKGWTPYGQACRTETNIMMSGHSMVRPAGQR